MSNLRSTNKVIAICCSDIHLSLTSPIWRSNEPDWLEAQYKAVVQVIKKAKKYECPILIAGDLFHKWNSPPELVNFAIKTFRKSTQAIFVIAGQHDLPHHDYKLIEKSSLFTLELADVIRIIHPNKYAGFYNSYVEGVPYGFIYDGEDTCEDLEIVMAHQYVYDGSHKYKGAPVESKITKDCHINGQDFGGLDVVIFGDNHDGFIIKRGVTTIINCGCLIRRRSDEKDYEPQVGIIYEDGSVKSEKLNTDREKFIELKGDATIDGIDLSTFFEQLGSLSELNLEFEELVKRYVESHKVSQIVIDIVRKSLES